MEWWLILICVIMGAAFVHSVLILSGAVRPRRDSFDIVIEFLKSENIQLRGEITELKTIVQQQSIEIKQLREQSTMLRTQIVLFESAQFDMPYPYWLTDYDGTIVFANKSFEDSILIPNGKKITEIIGKPISSVLGEAAELYFQNHRWVLSHKRPWEGAIGVQLNGKLESIFVLLYPSYSGKQIVGVYGMIIPNMPVTNF